MLACCARMVPFRGAGGVGDSVLAPRLGHGGFGAFGARWLSSRISARSACSVSLPTLAPLPLLPPSLPLSAHPPAPTTPVTRLFFPHSCCLPPQICVVNCFPLSAFRFSSISFQLSTFSFSSISPSSSSSGDFCLAWPIIHFPPLSRSIQSTGLAPASTTGGSVRKSKSRMKKI